MNSDNCTKDRCISYVQTWKERKVAGEGSSCVAVLVTGKLIWLLRHAVK